MCTHVVEVSCITGLREDRTIHSQDAHKYHVLLRADAHVALPIGFMTHVH